MVKSKVNLVIDALMFVAMAAIGGLGFLIKCACVSGARGRREASRIQAGLQ